jgi:hypothetical protein
LPKNSATQEPETFSFHDSVRVFQSPCSWALLFSHVSNVKSRSKEGSADIVEGKIIYSATAMFVPHREMIKAPPLPCRCMSLFLHISQKQFSVTVLITVKGFTKYIEGLIDSGAAGHFIDHQLVQELDIDQTPVTPPLRTNTQDGQPLSTGFITPMTQSVTPQI